MERQIRIRHNFGPGFCGRTDCDICFHDGIEGEPDNFDADAYRNARQEQSYSNTRERFRDIVNRQEELHKAESQMKERAFNRGAAIRARMEARKSGGSATELTAKFIAENEARQRASQELIDRQNEKNRQILDNARRVNAARELEAQRAAAILELAEIREKELRCIVARKLLADSAAIRAKLNGMKPKPMTIQTTQQIIEISFASLMNMGFKGSGETATYVGGTEAEMAHVELSEREQELFR